MNPITFSHHCPQCRTRHRWTPEEYTRRIIVQREVTSPLGTSLTPPLYEAFLVCPSCAALITYFFQDEALISARRALTAAETPFEISRADSHYIRCFFRAQQRGSRA